INVENQPSEIIFQLKNVEKTFFISRNVTYESLLKNVKVHFKIPICSEIAIVDSYSNRMIVVARTADLFDFTDAAIPKYKIIVQEPTLATKSVGFGRNCKFLYHRGSRTPPDGL
ncbi:unnamed protein product, partial [Adineta ricciae]